MPISAARGIAVAGLIMGESTLVPPTICAVTLQTRTREVREIGRRMRADSRTR